MVRCQSRAFVAGERPLAFAHRGGSGLWPENTLTAFCGALELGCDAIETDLRMTRDGQLVLFHDARLERTTNGRGFLHQLTLGRLKQLDAGYRFSTDGVVYPYRGGGVRVPTLDEVADLTNDCRLNIEIKPTQPELVAKLWCFIEQRGLHDRTLVAARDDRLLRRFRRLSRGRVATSAGFREAFRFWGASRVGAAQLCSPDYDALQVPPRYRGLTVVDDRLVRAAHSVGVRVHVWTVDEPAEMRHLLGLGVDGVMSDRPDRLLRVLRAGHGPRLPCTR
jgi:glycerophosphoryl diester phosphodiesterase